MIGCGCMSIGTMERWPLMAVPRSLTSSCRTVLTIRSGLSSAPALHNAKREGLSIHILLSNHNDSEQDIIACQLKQLIFYTSYVFRPSLILANIHGYSEGYDQGLHRIWYFAKPVSNAYWRGQVTRFLTNKEKVYLLRREMKRFKEQTPVKQVKILYLCEFDQTFNY